MTLGYTHVRIIATYMNTPAQTHRQSGTHMHSYQYPHKRDFKQETRYTDAAGIDVHGSLSLLRMCHGVLK